MKTLTLEERLSKTTKLNMLKAHLFAFNVVTNENKGVYNDLCVAINNLKKELEEETTTQ